MERNVDIWGIASEIDNLCQVKAEADTFIDKEIEHFNESFSMECPSCNRLSLKLIGIGYAETGFKNEDEFLFICTHESGDCSNDLMMLRAPTLTELIKDTYPEVSRELKLKKRRKQNG